MKESCAWLDYLGWIWQIEINPPQGKHNPLT